MKRSIFIIIVCAMFSMCSTKDSKEVSATTADKATTEASEKDTNVVFEEYEHDFGKVAESGGEVVFDFIFKNTGEQTLVITNVTASCGCTTPDWSKEPIAKGKKGFIKAVFNPKGQSSPFNKVLTVYSNGNPTRISLKIKGTIE